MYLYAHYAQLMLIQCLQISYRNLSRALKVHSNIAKQMLYEFHRKQNSKKPGSVHATYLITGTKQHPSSSNAIASQDDGQDTTMRSSPPLPSSSYPQPDEEVADNIPIRSIMIVKEEHLDQAKAEFTHITSIHIYSLQPTPLSDIHLLTECTRKVAVDYASEDPLKDWKQYGVIQNSNVKRRTRKGGPIPTMPAAPKKEEPAKAKPAPTLSKQASTNSNASAKEASSQPAKTAATKPAAGKKGSSLFASFAKTPAVHQKKPESQQSSNVEPEDVPMTGFSDDDDDDGDSALPEELQDDKAVEGKSKKDREADLKAMMEDDDDEPMEDAAESPTAEEAEKHDDGAIDKPIAKSEPKETVTVENGRRRGRRRVMKKKTVKDADGYLGKPSSNAHDFEKEETKQYLPSHARGARLGRILRRRARSQETKNFSTTTSCCNEQQVRSEERRRQAWSRKHHVLFQEELALRTNKKY